MLQQDETSPDAPGLARYVAVFGLTYGVALIVAGGVAALLQLDSGTGLSVATLLVSVLVSGRQFVIRQQRKPTRSERNRLALYCLGVSISVSCLFATAVIMMTAGIQGLHDVGVVFASLPWLAWVAIALFVSLLSFAVLLLGFGWLTGQYYGRLAGVDRAAD